MSVQVVEVEDILLKRKIAATSADVNPKDPQTDICKIDTEAIISE